VYRPGKRSAKHGVARPTEDDLAVLSGSSKRNRGLFSPPYRAGESVPMGRDVSAAIFRSAPEGQH